MKSRGLGDVYKRQDWCISQPITFVTYFTRQSGNPVKGVRPWKTTTSKFTAANCARPITVKNIPAMSEAQIDAETNPTATDSGPVHAPHLWRLFLYSGIGIFAFFIPFTVGEKKTILLDHIVSWIIATLGPGTGYLALAAIVAGTIYQFVSGRWREDYARTIFAFLSILAVVLCAMLVFDFGPAFLHNPDIGPFILNKLVISVGLLIPVGAIFLGLLVGFGLMEFIGCLLYTSDAADDLLTV